MGNNAHGVSKGMSRYYCRISKNIPLRLIVILEFNFRMTACIQGNV